MPNFRWTLNNTVSGTLVIGDPQGWETLSLTLLRDELWHSVNSEFTAELGFYCTLPSGIEGGKEYIDNIYETQGIDALITILIEYRCADESFDTLFDGKLNLPSYKTGIDDEVGEMTLLNLERNDFWQTVRDRRDIPINLNELFSLDGSALTPYTNAPRNIGVGSQVIDLTSEIDGAAFTATVKSFPMTGSPITINAFMQDALPVNQDDLETVSNNLDYITSGVGLTLDSSGLAANYSAMENQLISYPETYNISWNFTGAWTDCATPASTRQLLGSIELRLYFGSDITINTSFTTIGILPAGYPTSTQCPFTLSIPFAFVGGAAITVEQDYKFWLVWVINQYQQSAGGAITVFIQVIYTTSEIIYNVNSQLNTPGLNAGFAIYEWGARLSESLTDQTSFAFKSDLLGRTDSQPNVGGAPTYGADGCGSLNFLFSGLSLRGYGKHKIQPLKPDFGTMTDFFDCVNAVYNVGMGLEQHSNQDVLRLEERSFFYANSSIIQLTNVNNISFVNDESFSYNEFEVGYAQFAPENFNGLDEINTKQSYDLPIKTIKNKLTALSPYLASGYAIEDYKRIRLGIGKDRKYDNNNFIIAVQRFITTFVAEGLSGFSATTGIDNASSRRNMKLTPKRNFLRHLNVISAGIEKTAGATINFRSGADNFYFTTTQISIGCNGDYTGNLLDEDIDIAWDDANARLNSPLWIPEVYEFDHPLTEVQYTTIRNNPHGFIEFSSGTTVFIQGFILQIDYPLQGGLTHFKLLRRNS